MGNIRGSYAEKKGRIIGKKAGGKVK